MPFPYLSRYSRYSRGKRTMAVLAVLAALGTAGAVTTTELHPAAATRAGARIGLADSASNTAQCQPGGQLPIVTGGVLTLPGSCTPAQGGSIPQVGSIPQQQSGQQSQQCLLTEAQQQELVARAQDAQAAADQAFQSALLKNLLALAAAKADSAVLSAQLSGHTGLSPQDVASLIQNGTVTPADMAAAVLQTLQELGESSGDTVIDTCTVFQGEGNLFANNPSAGTDGQSGDQGGSTAPGTNVPADPLAAAADRNVDLSKIEPKDIVWRTDSDTLYREDARSPKEIFDDGGFQPKDVNGDYDLNNKVSENNDGPYVSTTKDSTTDVKKDWYLYKIEAPGGIDLEASPGVTAFDGEGEVVFPGGIDLSHVVGAWKYTFDGTGAAIQPGTWIDVKDFGNVI